MEQLISLNEDEYVYLSENLDIITDNSPERLPGYIMTERKANFKRLLNLALETELDQTEQKCIKLRFYEERSISEIAEALGLGRTQVYRIIDRAADKLYGCLKYAYFCGFGLLKLPENFETLIKNGGVYEHSIIKHH
ncbi:MAG: sigma-70 family RNA polymerase sigma factor [Ruminococcaceae bacterium]|nr:sigma-70 family RNA polymerase sigma factor [Oscillospiraceae bacterium]